MAKGEPLSDGALPVRAIDRDPIYVLSNKQKRWILTIEGFNKSNFSLKQVRDIARIYIDSIPSGPDWP